MFGVLLWLSCPRNGMQHGSRHAVTPTCLVHQLVMLQASFPLSLIGVVPERCGIRPVPVEPSCHIRTTLAGPVFAKVQRHARLTGQAVHTGIKMA